MPLLSTTTLEVELSPPQHASPRAQDTNHGEHPPFQSTRGNEMPIARPDTKIRRRYVATPDDSTITATTDVKHQQVQRQAPWVSLTLDLEGVVATTALAQTCICIHMYHIASWPPRERTHSNPSNPHSYTRLVRRSFTKLSLLVEPRTHSCEEQ